MASLERDPVSRRYRVRFRYAGADYKRSLRTSDEREAQLVLGRVEETIRMLDHGRLEMSDGADPGTFILSDGKRARRRVETARKTLGEVLDSYLAQIPDDSIEKTTPWGRG